jgi:hypothetical protein
MLDPHTLHVKGTIKPGMALGPWYVLSNLLEAIDYLTAARLDSGLPATYAGWRHFVGSLIVQKGPPSAFWAHRTQEHLNTWSMQENENVRQTEETERCGILEAL